MEVQLQYRLSSFASSLKIHEPLLLFALFSAPLMIGTVHDSTIIGVCGAVLISYYLFIFSCWSAKYERVPVSQAIMIILGIGCGLMLLQIVPMPSAILKYLSPVASRISTVLEANLGIHGMQTITLDPPATVLELLKGLTCLMVFQLTAVSGRKARLRLLQVLAISGFTVALIGFYLRATGSGRVLGFYGTDLFSEGRFVSTFVNPNHLAGYLGLTACISLGLGLDSLDRSRRVLFLFMAICCAAGVLMTLSRGGIAAFIGAQILLFIMLIRGRVPGKRNILWWQVSIILILGLTSWLAYSELLGRFETVSTLEKITANKKIEMMHDAIKMAGSYWPAGAGRGAFESAIDMFKRDGLHSWSHAENEYIQIACDLGIPYALLFLLIFTVVFIKLFSDVRAPYAMGALAGVYMLCLHNFVDFNMEITSISLAFFAAFGAVAGNRTPENDQSHLNGSGSKWFGLAAAIVGTLIIAGSIQMSGHVLKKDTERVSKYCSQGKLRQRMPEVASIIGMHRADYFLPLSVGACLASGDNQEKDLAIKYLLHAAFLNPKSSDPHRILARILMSKGLETQAFAEYRQTLRLNPGLVYDVLEELDKNTRNTGRLSRVIPEEPGPMANLVYYLIKKASYNEALAAGKEALSLFPDDFDVQLAVFRIYSIMKDIKAELAMGERLVAGHPSKVESHLNRAAALMDYGDILPAQAEIEMAQRLDPNAVWVLMRVADLYIRSGNLGKARDVTNTILMLPAIGAQELSNARYYLGRIYELEGRFQDAVKDYKRALVLYPSNEAATWGLERIYEKLGEKKKAIEVLEDYLNIMRGDIRAGAVLKKLKENEERQFHKNETEKLLEEDIPSDD